MNLLTRLRTGPQNAALVDASAAGSLARQAQRLAAAASVFQLSSAAPTI